MNKLDQAVNNFLETAFAIEVNPNYCKKVFIECCAPLIAENEQLIRAIADHVTVRSELTAERDALKAENEQLLKASREAFVAFDALISNTPYADRFSDALRNLKISVEAAVRRQK